MTIATPLSDCAHRLLAAHGPFASVYFDDSHNEPDSASRHVRCRDMARELEFHDADANHVSVVERAVRDA
jgi:peptide chain release factor subunit 1